MALDSAIGVISRWNNNSYVFIGNRDEIDQYLQAVDEIQRSIDSGTAENQSKAKSALQIAMLNLAGEMSNLMKFNSKSTDNYSSTMSNSGSSSYVDDYVYVSTLSVAVINDLQSIVKRMNGAGYVLDCKKAYISNRKHCIDLSYNKFDIQKLLSSTAARKLEWKSLELIIDVWMNSANICFRKILPYEKQLCEKIFGDLGDDCFVEISYDFAIQLLEIATYLSCIQTTPERLFGILKLYKTFSDLLPEMNKLFNMPSFRTKCDQIVPKLAAAAGMAIEKFEKDLLAFDLSLLISVDEISRTCRYVMQYVFKLGENKQTIMGVSLSQPPGVLTNFAVAEPQLQNKLQFHVMWIITCLVSRLEDAAKLYKKALDINFYLMNHFFYIVKKINGSSQVKEMIGDDCFEKVSAKFDQARAEYLRLTFEKVLAILGDNMSLQKRLKSFNGEFKKIQTNLGKLRVPDFQLLKDIRASMEDMLVPAYSSFLEQLSMSHCSTVDVKFSVEDLKFAIIGFFSST